MILELAARPTAGELPIDAPLGSNDCLPPTKCYEKPPHEPVLAYFGARLTFTHLRGTHRFGARHTHWLEIQIPSWQMGNLTLRGLRFHGSKYEFPAPRVWPLRLGSRHADVGHAMTKISFAIPVYRNAGALSKTHEKICTVFANQLRDYDLEIVFVDDGSDDGSLAEILEIRARDPRVKAITFTRNFGQMAAILAGLKEASGELAINISADLQDPVELIPEMVTKWQEGAEIVVAYRTDRADSLSAKIFSRMAYGALRWALPQLPQGGFDFVLIDRKPLDAFNAMEAKNRFFQGDLLWTGYRTCFIPYVRLKREIGKSQYNFSKKLKNFADAFLDASYLPIRFISAVGAASFLLSILYSASVVYAWAVHSTPFAGWAPIMIALFFVGGLLMLMLGIIGEYVWRIYDELRNKPNYIVREKHL